MRTFSCRPDGRGHEARLEIHCLEVGQMPEHWDIVDVFGLMVQIGGFPGPAAAR